MNRLGIDIGRVIIAGGTDAADTSFFGKDLDAVLATPEVPGAFETIARLRDLFEGRVWLVSKCGPRIQRRSLDWLAHRGFWDVTGVDPANVRFCLTRPEKAGIARDLGLTHMVDDRPDVHEALAGVVEHRYLFGPQKPGATGCGAELTPTWVDVAAAISVG